MGYTQDLVAHWDLSTDNPPDICWRGNRYPGAGANIVGHPDGIAGGRCAEFNGNNSNINVGDVVELNAVEKFTIALWMDQDVIDVVDYLFYKYKDADEHIQVLTSNDGNLYVIISNGIAGRSGRFDYSTVISAQSWHHLAVVYDGSGAADADRLKIYVDGAPMTLTFASAIPATAPDLSGIDATIGIATNSFDGKLDEFMIFSAALTQLQIADLYNRTRQGRF